LFLRNRVPKVSSVAVGPPPAEILLFGLQLSGVWFAVSGLVGTFRAVGYIMTVEESFTLHFTDAATSLAYICIGLFLVFRATKLVRIIAT
jgi:hypothetical protein